MGIPEESKENRKQLIIVINILTIVRTFISNVLQPVINSGQRFAFIYTADFLNHTLNPLFSHLSQRLYDPIAISTVCETLKQCIRLDVFSLETTRNTGILLSRKGWPGAHSSQDQIDTSIKDYGDYVTSDKTRKEREYMYYSGAKPTWTAEDYGKFTKALQIYKDSPSANRKIAKYMGKHVHPNHVRYERKELRRKLYKSVKVKIFCNHENEVIPYNMADK